MKINYDDFLARFEASGMTQQEFGKQEGLSSSMVSYYVKRGREAREGGFARVKVIKSEGISRSIKITYPSGVQVDLPI